MFIRLAGGHRAGDDTAPTSGVIFSHGSNDSHELPSCSGARGGSPDTRPTGDQQGKEENPRGSGGEAAACLLNRRERALGLGERPRRR